MAVRPRRRSGGASPEGWRPPLLPYVAGDAVPPGYTVETRGGGLMLTMGGLLWGTAYVGGLYAASNAGFENGTSWLVLPIIGPWAAIGKRNIPCDSSNINVSCVDDAEDEIVAYALLTGAGITQILGASLLLVGVSQRSDWLVRDDLASVAILPVQLGPSGVGLGAFGRF